MATTDEPQTTRQEHGYAKLYTNIALCPELGRFRRFASQWAKLLHDDTQEILFYERKVHEQLKGKRPAPSGVNVLDIQRSTVQLRYPDIYENYWKPYEEALRQYGSDFRASQHIVAQPDQATWATRSLSTLKEPVFENGLFGVTGEGKDFYLAASELHDSCVWRTSPHQDFLAERIFQVIPWVDRHIFRHFRSAKVRKSESGMDIKESPYIRYHVLVEAVDFLTCIMISLLLTTAIFALQALGPGYTRSGVVGALGTVFGIVVKVLAGGPSRRIEVYAVIAAFFAVVSVFVSNSNG